VERTFRQRWLRATGYQGTFTRVLHSVEPNSLRNVSTREGTYRSIGFVTSQAFRARGVERFRSR